jgi:hypothetical protein
MTAAQPTERQGVKRRVLPNRERIAELLRYDSKTGKLYWRPRSSNRQFSSHYAGAEAFTTAIRNGYLTGKIDDVSYAAHRVIWKLMTGDEPEAIDHINGNTADNRWFNLRAADAKMNNRNKCLAKNNASGATGVYAVGLVGDGTLRWRARIVVGRRQKYLGTFPTFEAALAARKEAETQLGFSSRHGSTK